MSTDKSFLGTGWSFPPEFSKRGQVKMVSAEEDIVQSLRILLATNPGERVMRSSFGCGIKHKIYENINETTVTILKDLIKRSILFFEPRITLDAIHADIVDVYSGYLNFVISYTIVSSNTRHNLVYPFYFREGSDVAL
ncbi:GPW/gp25 family protein [Undibacterium flavidum]|uniref:GPW/gp25 family protein n=1 Tax=Undibacterium flavidum TaxID=2762297 RepID=A0ABR6YFG9_9BURK|nr:GPW/gp25 family protein [Undibacterium flavidum]MBC3875293.1 GPW/gp25 family protein [Undibacterium flavidum]